MNRPRGPSSGAVLGLLRTRSRFRTLYFADALSMMGDWLTYVAVALLALRGPQGIVGVALVQMAHSLPQAVTAPIAGWLTDRIDRRALLVGASLARGALTLGMALAALRGEVLWVELFLFARMAGASFVQAPSRAALPQLVERGELEAANRLLASSWAVLFTAGVALGGLVTGLFGPEVALFADAATFGLAALIFAGVGPLPPLARAPLNEEASLIRDARRFPERLAAALAKAPMFFASGATYVVMHAVMGAGAGVAFGLGGLHAARGVGNGVGPFLFRRLGDRGAVLAGLIATLLGGAALLFDHPAARVIGCLVWGVGVGATWVGGTVWLQRVTPDGILGRYASVDLGASGVASAGGGLLAALVCAFAAPWLAVVVVSVGALTLFGALRLSRLTRAAALVATLAVLLAVPIRASAQGRLEVGLAARAVTDASYARRELWTWTTRAQAAALRRDRVLLRARAEDGERSPYQRALDALRVGVGAHADLAQLLTEHPALAARRYAWSTPYGTVTPRGSRSYGPVLVRIELAPDAWTLRFAPDEATPFSAADGAGRRLDLADVLAHPTRIGAVYHVREEARGGAFREIVVHGRVLRWSMGTDAIRQRLAEERRLLSMLARRLRRDSRGRSMRAHWRAPAPSVLGRFAATMPFDTPRHRASAETLQALITALGRRRPRGPPLLVESPGE